MICRAAQLTKASFAMFGDVIEHCGVERRHVVTEAFRVSNTTVRQSLWVSRIEESVSLPAKVTRLERHPHSDQAFIPLLGQPYLVVACAADDDGMPDLGSALAFIAGSRQGVIYRRNVWHFGLTVLAEPAEFVVVMARTGGIDDVFQDLGTPLTVLAEDDPT